MVLAIGLVGLAYYGVPVVFLISPVQDHLQYKYGVHVDVGSVRVSVRGLVVTGVSAVWPEREATLAVQEMMLGFSPVKSLRRRRLVFERLKILHPIITLRLPDRPAAAPELSEPAGISPQAEDARLPQSFDLTIRRGKFHVMRGSWSAVIQPFDAEIERSAPGNIDAWVKLDSREIGRLEIFFEEGRAFKLEAEALQLAALTEIAGTPHKLQGQLFARLTRAGGEAAGNVRVDGLMWSGPNPEDSKAAPPPADTPIADIAIDTVSFISLPLDAGMKWKGRWAFPNLTIDEGEVSVGGIRVQSSGTVQLSRRLDGDLDFYAPEFDEPALEQISRHFHVLRFLRAFLETIESPSRLQAKMHLKGPLARPAGWHYEGLVDIRRDTFSYDPFLGQYSFSGTVEFNEHGVRIPEILIPFGPSNLMLSGTAADYATRTARMDLKGKGLQIGPMIHYYVPAPLKVQDPTPADGPAGHADVNLQLTRFGASWRLDGDVDIKRVSIPIRNVAAPVRAFGRIGFSGTDADGTLRVRIGSFESALNPFVRFLFSSEVEYGVYLKQNDIRWDRLAQSVDSSPTRPPAGYPGDSLQSPSAPPAFLPLAGRGDVSLKMFCVPHESRAAESAAVPSGGWNVEGTMDIQGTRFYLPPFSSPVDSASLYLTFENKEIHMNRAAGVLAHTPIQASGRSRPGDARSWDLVFRTPLLDLASLVSNIRPARRHAAEGVPFDVSAEVSADKLVFRGFEIPGVTGTFNVRPDRLTVHVDTPILTEYVSTEAGQDLLFAVSDSYPLKNIFHSQTSLSGDLTGTLRLTGKNLSDSRSISGHMDLFLDRLTFKKAPPLLKLIDLMSFSLTDAVVFPTLHFKSDIEKGAVSVNLDQPSNVGRWILKGKLGLDATYMPADTDSDFHVTFFPRENLLTRLLHETKILDLLGGKREGIKLDFHLIGNYNNSNILWTEEPFVSVIRGRVSELVPGFFGAAPESPAQPDQEAVDPPGKTSVPTR